MIAALLDHLWQSTLFAAAVAGLVLALRRQAAWLRFALWLAASLKFLVPFSALVLLGRFLFPATIIPGADSGAILARLTPAMLPFSTSPVLGVTPPVLLASQALLIIWAAGSMVALGRVLWHAGEMQLLLRDAVDLDIAAPVPVKSAPSFLEPGLVGIWRPVILLPQGLARNLTRDEMDAVLSHELSHFARRDNLTAAVHMLVEALFWFHPLVWWIGRRLIEERERACDENVLAEGSTPLVYAELILKICRYYVQTPLACASGMSGPDLNVRLTAIMAGGGEKKLPPGAAMLLAMAGAATLMLPLAAGMLGSSPLTPIAARMERALNIALPVPASFPQPASAAPHRAVFHHHRATPVIAAPMVASQTPPAAAAPLTPAATAARGAVLISTVTPSVPAIEPVDDMQCRRPQQLPGSRLTGPTICKPKSEWAALTARGLDVAPDGSIYEKAAYLRARALEGRVCNGPPPGTSTVNLWANSCF